MGSCTHIVDDRNILNQYEYDAWGNVVNQKETVKNRFKFNGQQLDPITQQYYLRARFYNPIIARFTQEDTYRGDGLNLYSYCANNPVYYVDPSGNACEPAKEILEDILNKNKILNTNIDEKGYRPKPGERTLEGFVNNHVSQEAEVSLYTNSKSFNNVKAGSSEFKRFGSKPGLHGIKGSHVHQPIRNCRPNGEIHTTLGRKTKDGSVGSPTKKDVSQLYDHLFNEKYKQ